MSDIIGLLMGRIARGETESQRDQKCEHEYVSSCGAGLSGICLDCGADVFAERAEAFLAAAQEPSS